jgi:light-regulated signal transduction histidine kinase (bacteriophytochrome)
MSSSTTPEETKSTEERIRRFLAVASHDLQSPLRHIAMYSEILLEDLEGRISADEKQSLTTILEKVQTAQKLTKALMTFASGTPQAARENVDLTIASETAWSEATAEFPETKAVLAHHELPELRTDPTLLTAVLKQLFVNAIAHGEREDPRVEVGAVRDGGELVISVADNGRGIDPAHQARIFEAFWKLPKAGRVPGPGLGLTVCRELVASLGGTVTLAASSGSGSRFEIRLPA